MESSGLKGPVGAAGTASAAESVEGAERDRSVADRFEDALRKREAGKRKPDPQPGGVPTWLPWLATYEPQLSLNVDARRAALAADVAERAHLAGQRDAGEAAPLPERTQRAERTDAPGDASDRIREKTSAQTSPDAAAAVRRNDGGADAPDARESTRLQTIAIRDAGASERHHATVGGTATTAAIAGHDGAASMSGRGGHDVGERRKGEPGPAGVAAVGPLPAPGVPWQGMPPRAAAPMRSPFMRTGSNVRHEASSRTGAVPAPGMRYAFQQWGDGHFVQIRAAEIDGQPGFVLGASDPTVQRRLSAMWSAASDAGACVAGSGVAVHAIEPVGADPQSGGEDGEGSEGGEGDEGGPC